MIESILFFGDYPNSADPSLSVFFQTLIYAIADMGVKCTVISPVSVTKYRNQIRQIPYCCEEKTKNGSVIKVYRPKYISYSSKVIGKLDTHTWTVKSLRKAAEKVVEKEKLVFDATYGHFINIGGVSACRVGSRYKVPSFVANGESDLNPTTYNYSSGYDLNPFKDCTGVISVSSKNKQELIERQLIDERRITVIPNAIDDSLFRPLEKEDCRHLLDLPKDAFIVGFVGGFSERKGSDRVYKACEKIPDCYMAFCGKGDSKPTGEKVFFCSSLPHDEIPVFLNAIDVFVLPTLNEGCCNAVLEAMACRVPIITSDKPFNYDILTTEEAVLVDPADVEKIRDAIKFLMGNSEKRKQLCESAYNRSKLFTIHERARRIIEYMESCTKEQTI